MKNNLAILAWLAGAFALSYFFGNAILEFGGEGAVGAVGLAYFGFLVLVLTQLNY